MNGYIYAMVDSQTISPETFREARKRAQHKQESLALALGCSLSTIRNFETGKTRRLYSVRWADLARELGIRFES